MRAFPQVVFAFSRCGTPDIAAGPTPPNACDTYVILKPQDGWSDPSMTKPDLIAARVRQSRRNRRPAAVGSRFGTRCSTRTPSDLDRVPGTASGPLSVRRLPGLLHGSGGGWFERGCGQAPVSGRLTGPATVAAVRSIVRGPGTFFMGCTRRTARPLAPRIKARIRETGATCRAMPAPVSVKPAGEACGMRTGRPAGAYRGVVIHQGVTMVEKPRHRPRNAEEALEGTAGSVDRVDARARRSVACASRRVPRDGDGRGADTTSKVDGADLRLPAAYVDAVREYAAWLKGSTTARSCAPTFRRPAKRDDPV